LRLQLPKSIWQFLTVLLATVVLLLAVFSGVGAGKSQAQSQLVANNAQETVKGLKYFYNDNNRFPAVLEYQNQSLMLNYFNYFPPQDFVSTTCNTSLMYKRINGNSIQLDFCLPKAVSGYQVGWNQFTENK
jgi:hypothetical protein